MNAARIHKFPHRTFSALPSLLALLLILQLALFTFGCGGGSQQSTPPPPSSPDFTLAAAPTTAIVSPGSGTSVSISAAGVNGFSSQVSVQLSGLAAGVSATPASFTLTPGTPQSVVLSASISAPVNTSTATFTGTSGSLSHTTQVTVSVSAQTTAALPSRTRYVRSDAVTEYGYSLNSHWEVFHSPTSRFFVTDPDSNQVFVFDSATESEIGSIAVPGAYGIDQTPDQKTLYVGTLIGDVYTIDPSAMTVTHRYIASQIGPNGYSGIIALPLSNGSIALLGAAGGIPSVDGSSSFAIWNPATNSITLYASSYGLGQLNAPATVVCGPLENIGGFGVTADRSTVVLGSIDSDSTLCEVNAATGQDDYVTTETSFIYRIAASSDGNYIALPVYPSQVTLYDAHTLAKVNQFAVAGDTSSASNLIFSADSQTLFVPSASTVYGYGVVSGQLTGWLSNLVVEPESGGGNVGPSANPNFEASDGTGLLAGPMEEGFGFLDTTTLHTGPVGTAFLNGYLTPATGPASGGTATQWEAPLTDSSGAKVYFGGSPSSSVTADGGNIAATTPAGSAGPVPVYLFAPDGGTQLIPDGFSYGPSILEVTPNTATTDGGGTGIVYGYGFGSTSTTTVPSNLTVTVGGASAAIVGFNPNAYNNIAPPFLLQSVYFTIPPGTSAAAVSVTTGSGQTVAPSVLTYLPAAKQFPLAGSQLAQGVYDPIRDLYYFTDVNRIQVFSLSQGQWLPAINIPAPNGAAQRLWGIALSPDSTKLAVTDAQADAIYLINPANTSSIQTFAGPSEEAGVSDDPAGIAISDAGIAYITVAVEGVSSGDGFYKLDTNTGTLTSYGNSNPGLSSYNGSGDLYLRTEITSDNSHVFFNNDGYVFSINTATDTVSPPTVDQGCCYGNYDLALASQQTQFESSSYLYDMNLNAESSLVMNDREASDVSYVYGAKFSPDGSLLFQPSANGVDVFDGRLGLLLKRIALPFALSTNYDALVADGSDNKLIAITGANGDGIAVLDLTSIAQPAPLGYAAQRSASLARALAGRDAVNFKGLPSQQNPAMFGVRVIPHITHFIQAPFPRIRR